MEQIMTSALLQLHLQAYGEPSKNYKLIITHFNDPFCAQANLHLHIFLLS